MFFKKIIQGIFFMKKLFFSFLTIISLTSAVWSQVPDYKPVWDKIIHQDYLQANDMLFRMWYPDVYICGNKEKIYYFLLHSYVCELLNEKEDSEKCIEFAIELLKGNGDQYFHCSH